MNAVEIPVVANPNALFSVDVFVAARPAEGKKVKGAWKAPISRGYGYQLNNPDPVMEERMGRLPGSGSFCWPSLADAFAAALEVMEQNPDVDQCKVRSGQCKVRVHRQYDGRVDAYDASEN